MFQYSVEARNAGLDARYDIIGPSAKLRIFSGAEPVDCAAADPVGLLVEMDLPAVWMDPAADGLKVKAGVWSAAGAAAGAGASFRIYDSALAQCHIQGTATLTGGGGDMEMDNADITIGQTVTVTKYQVAAGNA